MWFRSFIVAWVCAARRWFLSIGLWFGMFRLVILIVFCDVVVMWLPFVCLLLVSVVLAWLAGLVVVTVLRSITW